MSFDTHGFFSPQMIRFRTSVRNAPASKVWFDFADELIRLGLDLLNGHETPLEDRQQFTISVLFIRGHQSFQAALLLCQNGMIGDARTVLRSAVEGAIAAIATEADPTFVDQLIAAHRKHQLTVAQEELADPDYRSLVTPEQIGKLEQLISELNLLKGQSGREPKNIIWADVAKTHCKDLYRTLYRLLSVDGVHTTADALNRHVEADHSGRITALKVGPDFADLVDTLRAACLTILWSAAPFARTFKRKDVVASIDAHIQRFATLPTDELA
jgi:hypothetical protein